MKFPINGYAPGNYQNECAFCKQMFIGDKRAVTCLSCAVEMLPEPAPTYEQIEAVVMIHVLHNGGADDALAEIRALYGKKEGEK